jgi:hypothetical protein
MSTKVVDAALYSLAAHALADRTSTTLAASIDASPLPLGEGPGVRAPEIIT